MQRLNGAAISSLLGAFLWAVPAHATVEARPGSVNYVEGQVTIANQNLDAKSIGSTELEPGQSLATGAGKAEILLTPGVFFRVGDNSSARMLSPNLTDTEIELTHGSATVEVTEIHEQNNLRVIEGGKSTELMKRGLYDFDADSGQMRVFDGQAEVQDGRKEVKVKAGHEAILADEPVKTQKFDKQALEATDLYRWTSLRSSYLAEANVDEARTLVAGGPGWFGLGWYWDPWFDAYTFIPGDGIFYSPFGWGFYSPGFVWAAPFFWGPHYYHYFGANYRAWGPGFHYGMPYNYGRGVVYGPRPMSAGGSVHAGSGGRGFGYSGGGFHGGGFQGGGFRR
jgi:hypothetical protein